MKRILGRSGIEVSAMGLGCWAIGGQWTFNGGAGGWGVVDDAELIRAIRRAIDLGVTFFDTAANYGCGRSERVLGAAIKGIRDKVSSPRNSVTRSTRTRRSSRRIRRRRRLPTSPRMCARTSSARSSGSGSIASTSACFMSGASPRNAPSRFAGNSSAFATAPRCAVVEQQLSVFDGNAELLAHCERENLASVNWGPLAMGLLTGKFGVDARFSKDDFRRTVPWHPGYENGRPRKSWVDALGAVWEILTSEGRTLAQGSLAWIWARSPNTVPIPGFRNERQAEENARAMEKGPLTPAQMAEIARILSGISL